MSFSTIAANVARLWSQYSGVYFQGLLGTLGLAAITVLFGTVLGTVTAICRLSGFRPGQALARFYVWIIRGTPVLLQLYFFWLLLPELLPLEIDETESVVVALIISAGAFVSEIIRAGVQAIDPGQTEAAQCLGLSRVQTYRFIILPQAIKNILPALGNEFVNMIKQASLASVFFVSELTTSCRTVSTASFLAIEPLLISGLIYLAVTTVFGWRGGGLEHRLAVANAG